MVEYIWAFILDHGVLCSAFVFLGVMGLDFYTNSVRVNLDTDNVDLMERYLWLNMRRRFYDENL